MAWQHLRLYSQVSNADQEISKGITQLEENSLHDHVDALAETSLLQEW